MKKVDKKNMEGVFGKLLIFVAFSVGIIIASYVISIFCVTASMSEIKPFSEIIFYIGNWPSIVLKVYPTITDPNGIVVLDGEKAQEHPPTILLNSLPWLVIGYITAGIIIRGKRKRK